MISRVHALAVRQLEGMITAGEHRELESLLLENAAARQAYVAYFEDTACLRWLCLEELAGSIEPAKTLRENTSRPDVRRRIETFTILGGLACFFAVLAGTWMLNPSPGRSTSASNGASTNVVATLPQQGAEMAVGGPAVGSQPALDVSKQVATVTGLGQVRWLQPLHRRHLLSRCDIGDRLQLREGAVELTFDAGAQVTVFAPADFEITSATSIRCKSGRVTALVDERGKGFVVHTPQAKVVDLGTQFGLSISENGETEVVVFQGSVDMSYASPAASGETPTRRMGQGEALLLNNSGEFERVVSIQRNDFLTAIESLRRRPPEPVIADVSDNIRTAEGVKSYQIVRGGLEDDAPCFVDRSHQWNGLERGGLPEFLVGADYIMPFNDDKFVRRLELKLQLLRPATLYVFLDNNMNVPKWLREGFEDTGIDIGMDGGKTEWHRGHSLADGAGRSIDFPFSVWKREVKQAGTITLGSVDPPKVGSRSYGFNMYGIAAVAAD